MTWLKNNWQGILTIGTFIIALIVLFNTCNQEKQGNVYIFPDSIDKAIDIKLDSLHKSQSTIELQPQIIQQKYYNETNNYINLTDTLKPVKCMQFARELLR